LHHFFQGIAIVNPFLPRGGELSDLYYGTAHSNVSGRASQSRLNSFFFIQMADTQFGFFTDNQDFKKETTNFEKAIPEANRLRPAFVVVCGDLVNKPGDPDQIAEYKRISSTLDPAIKLYNVAGNHDADHVPTRKSLMDYRTDFDPDYYTFQAGNLFAIVLNSSLMRDPDSAREEADAQELWLRTALDQARSLNNKLIMVFQHHSLFLTDAEEPDQYFNFPGGQRKVYLELFKEYKVTCVFAGHYHRSAWGRAGDLEMVTTGPVGKPLGSDPSGFRVVTVDGRTVNHQYYSLDSIPDIVKINE
jgi:3',5'-cyclic AMP phosphodiesterase CpdA